MNTFEHYTASGGGAAALEYPVERQNDPGLEQLIAQQREQLAEAVEYLQEAAFLARYHQPSLERHIRAFLQEIQL